MYNIPNGYGCNIYLGLYLPAAGSSPWVCGIQGNGQNTNITFYHNSCTSLWIRGTETYTYNVYPSYSSATGVINFHQGSNIFSISPVDGVVQFGLMGSCGTSVTVYIYLYFALYGLKF